MAVTTLNIGTYIDCLVDTGDIFLLFLILTSATMAIIWIAIVIHVVWSNVMDR